MPIAAETLPLHLRNLPVVIMHSKSADRLTITPGADDNSNTQFALLALWAARRHDVPTEQALLLAQKRFYHSQFPDGRWAYNLNRQHSSPAMTARSSMALYTTEIFSSGTANNRIRSRRVASETVRI